MCLPVVVSLVACAPSNVTLLAGLLGGASPTPQASGTDGEATVSAPVAPVSTPTPGLTPSPVVAATSSPSPLQTLAPDPSASPSASPTEQPTPVPSATPTEQPTPVPSASPTEQPTPEPTVLPTASPTPEPSLSGIVTVAGVPRGGALVQVSAPGQETRQVVSDEGGHYAFYDLPAGTYTVVVRVRDAVVQTLMVEIP